MYFYQPKFKRDLFLSLICGIVISMPIVMVFAGRFIEALTPFCAILIVIYLIWHNELRAFLADLLNLLKTPIGLMALAFMCLITINSLRSIELYHALHNVIMAWITVISIFVLGVFLVNRTPPDFGCFYIKTMITACFLIVIMQQIIPRFPEIGVHFGNSFHLFARIENSLVIWVWPTLYLVNNAYKGYEIEKTVLMTALTFVVISGYSATVKLIFPLAILLFFATKYNPLLWAKGFFTLVISSFLLAPFLHKLPYILFTESFLKTIATKSSGIRIDIWTFYSKLSFEKPLFGWGFDFTRYSNHLPEMQALSSKGSHGLAMHPHMQQLQIFLELGWIGSVLAAGIAYHCMKITLRASLDKIPTILACSFAIVTTMTINFSLWQQWIMCMFSYGIILLAMDAHRSGQATIKG